MFGKRLGSEFLLFLPKNRRFLLILFALYNSWSILLISCSAYSSECSKSLTRAIAIAFLFFGGAAMITAAITRNTRQMMERERGNTGVKTGIPPRYIRGNRATGSRFAGNETGLNAISFCGTAPVSFSGYRLLRVLFYTTRNLSARYILPVRRRHIFFCRMPTPP